MSQRTDDALRWIFGTGLPHLLGFVFIATLVNTTGWPGLIAGAGYGYIVAKARKESP